MTCSSARTSECNDDSIRVYLVTKTMLLMIMSVAVSVPSDFHFFALLEGDLKGSIGLAMRNL
jgi:hypothetical protein